MPRRADLVLGIDAAWSARNPSGIALLQRRGARWRSLRVAPSYTSFCERPRTRVDWEATPAGGLVDFEAVRRTCGLLAPEGYPTVVAVDMPVSLGRIAGRREADSAVSKAFGHLGCAVYTPSAHRPGAVGQAFSEILIEAGYTLCTCAHEGLPSLLEVYPHVSLICLMNADYRLRYKAYKTTDYWPEMPLDARKRLLLKQWKHIRGRLDEAIDGIVVPAPSASSSFAHLKRYEDALDALVCAWTATIFLAKDCTPLGDAQAAIWVPNSALPLGRFADASA